MYIVFHSVIVYTNIVYHSLLFICCDNVIADKCIYSRHIYILFPSCLSNIHIYIIVYIYIDYHGWKFFGKVRGSINVPICGVAMARHFKARYHQLVPSRWYPWCYCVYFQSSTLLGGHPHVPLLRVWKTSPLKPQKGRDPSHPPKLLMFCRCFPWVFHCFEPPKLRNETQVTSRPLSLMQRVEPFGHSLKGADVFWSLKSVKIMGCWDLHDMSSLSSLAESAI